MTIEELREGLPSRQKKLVTQNVVDVMNNLEGDEGVEFAEHYKQNFISASSIMQSSVYSMGDYISAVKFVSYKLLDYADIDAYMNTFPDRYQRLIDKWSGEMDEQEIRTTKISSFVTAYKKNDIVVKITEQSLVPSKILNAHLFQDALNVQASLMYTARSEMVRSQAAESVMRYTNMPEAQKIELEVGIKGQDEILALRNEMHNLASQQQLGIKDKSLTSEEIAHSVLLHEEAIDVETE